MTDYGFYLNFFHGSSIPEDEFPAYAAQAQAKLKRYQRIYRVEAPEDDSEDMAVCAMADAMYFFDAAQNVTASGVVSSASIGSVSVSYGGASSLGMDLSPKGQEKELYRCASLYLNIYRGCG